VSFQATELNLPSRSSRRVAPTPVTSGSLVGHEVTRVQVGGAQRFELPAARERLLGGGEALADDVAETVVDHVLLGGDDLREARGAHRLVGWRLDEQDLRARRQCVGVLHVQGGLARGPDHFRVARVVGRNLSGRRDDLERSGRRVAEPLVEGGQVVPDRRRAERVHDHDGRARAGDLLPVQLRKVVRGAELIRLVAREPVAPLALAGSRRGTEPVGQLGDSRLDVDAGQRAGRRPGCGGRAGNRTRR
jgi:hypothetical protein